MRGRWLGEWGEGGWEKLGEGGWVSEWKVDG